MWTSPQDVVSSAVFRFSRSSAFIKVKYTGQEQQYEEQRKEERKMTSR